MQVEKENLFYILYYSLAFSIVTHASPFFAIASRDKDIIDALHHAQDVLPIQQQLEQQQHQTLADVEKLIMNMKKRHGPYKPVLIPCTAISTSRTSTVCWLTSV